MNNEYTVGITPMNRPTLTVGLVYLLFITGHHEFEENIDIIL